MAHVFLGLGSTPVLSDIHEHPRRPKEQDVNSSPGVLQAARRLHLSLVLSVRNENLDLATWADQCDLRHSPLDRLQFELLLQAENCDDQSAADIKGSPRPIRPPLRGIAN
jgi:hypothetical protein